MRFLADTMLSMFIAKSNTLVREAKSVDSVCFEGWDFIRSLAEVEQV